MYVRIDRRCSIFKGGEWVAKRGGGIVRSGGNEVSVGSRSQLTHTYLPHHPRYQHTSKDITTTYTPNKHILLQIYFCAPRKICP